jgi:hypothetical protein
MKSTKISILLVDFLSPTNHISSSGLHFRLLASLFFAHGLYTMFFSLLDVLATTLAILQTLGRVILCLIILSYA